MSLKHILCASALALGIVGTAAPVSADPGHGRHDRGAHGNRGWHGDRGQHRGWRNHGRHCRVVWRHHNRVRVCR